MKVTFDTNVWQKVILPEKYSNDSLVKEYRTIKDVIKNKAITPFISETIFTIEGIDKKDRLDFLRSDKPNIQFNHIETNDGSIGIEIVISPNPEIHPGNNEFLKEYLEEALSLGFNIFHLPRIGGITNPEMANLFYKMDEEEIERMHEVSTKIENHSAGVFHAMEIGFKYDSSAWYVRLGKAPKSEMKKTVYALAEWSDGDSIAGHIGILGDYFCTNDSAKTSGPKSILSVQNKKWLQEEYSFKTISPKGLSDILISSKNNTAPNKSIAASRG